MIDPELKHKMSMSTVLLVGAGLHFGVISLLFFQELREKQQQQQQQKHQQQERMKKKEKKETDFTNC